MSLVNFPNINNLDSATADLFNSRFAAITAVLNGNVDAANLKDGTITYGKLNLATRDVPSDKISMTPTTTTNSGTAGGSLNYIQIGTFLMYWGTTNQLSFPGNANTTYTVTFPVAFATLPTLTFVARENTAVGNLPPFQVGAPTVTSGNLTLANTSGTTGTAKIDWHAVGKGT